VVKFDYRTDVRQIGNMFGEVEKLGINDWLIGCYEFGKNKCKKVILLQTLLQTWLQTWLQNLTTEPLYYQAFMILEMG